MKFVFLLFCGFSLLLNQRESFSQCCAAGNPVSTNCSLTNGGKNTLSVSLFSIYSNSDTYFSGINKTDNKYMSSDFTFSSLNLTYGLFNKLRISADLGYFFKKSQDIHIVVANEQINQNRYTQGLGDGSIGLIYDTYLSDDNLFSISQSARLTIPVGPFDQQFDGVVLPIDFQPSSGNYKYNLGIILSKRFENSDFSLMSSNSIEISRTIVTESTYHKYGNLYNLSVMGLYNPGTIVSGMLQVRFEVRDKALTGSRNKDNVYSYLNSSGGVIAYLSPQINLTPFKNWMLSLQFNQPVYKNVNGEQLTNKYSFSANISKSFDFSSAKESTKIQPADTTLSKTTLIVQGNCEMCKARIEKVTNEFKNVEESDWEPETKSLTVYYKNQLPDIDGIQKALATAGHDNEKYKAKDDAYAKLPKCCLYREK